MTAPNLEQLIAKCADHLSGFTPAEFAAHVVAAIRDSGYTVIALPEPKKRLPAAIGTGWDSAMRVTIWDNNPGIITIPVAYEPLVDDEGVANLAPDEAADLGAALIAAAQHATGDTQ